jgi:ABC-type transporter Mla subunit MlaD
MAVKRMKRCFVLLSLLLSGLIIGCASDTEMYKLQADTSSLQRQSGTYQQTMEAKLQQLGDRVAKVEEAQAATRRDIAQAAAQADELRNQVRRLQGEVQETQHQAQRGAAASEGGTSPKLANVETRIKTLEQQLPAPRQ